MDDCSEDVLIVGVDWVVKYELIVVSPRVVDVPVLSDQLHAVDTDVDTQSRLAIPVEVGRLRHVRHVVGRLQVAGVVEIFDNDVSG